MDVTPARDGSTPLCIVRPEGLHFNYAAGPCGLNMGAWYFPSYGTLQNRSSVRATRFCAFQTGAWFALTVDATSGRERVESWSSKIS